MGLVTMPPDPIPSALYLRASPKPEGAAGDNFSIDSQLFEGRAFLLKKYGCSNPDIYIDKDRSGATLDRPELDRLRDNLALKLYKGGVVIAYSPDRWTRGGEMDAVILKQELTKGGAKIDYCSGSYEDTPEGELAQDVQNCVSKYERAKFRERSRRCRRQKSRDGHPHACAPPDGYKYEGHKFGKKGSYVIVPERAEIVLLIFTKLAGGDYTEGRLAKWLNQQRIKTKKGFNWGRNSVSQIVKKRCYTGEMSQNDVIIKVPVIVPLALWEAAHEALERNKAGKRGRPSRHYLLSHLLYCKRCKWKCNTFPSPGPDGGSYRCNNVHHAAITVRRCMAPMIRRKFLEPVVWDAVWNAICEPVLLWELIEAYHGRVSVAPKKSTPEMIRIEKARRLVERRKQILDDPDSDYAEAKANLEAAKKELANAQMAAPGATVRQMPLRRNVETARAAFVSMRHNIKTFEGKREALELLVEKVYYADGEAEIHCHLPVASSGKCHSRECGNDNFGNSIPFVINATVELPKRWRAA